MKRLVLVLLVLVALIGTSAAQCSCVNDNCKECDLPSYATFKMTSQVQGDGLVVANRDVKTASPDYFEMKDDTLVKNCCVDVEGNPGQQLKMHTHGTGNYEENSDVKYNLDDNKAKLTVNESATMTFAPAAVPTQAVSVKWKDDVCLKDYQLGVAMRERYYAAESVTKTTHGMIESVATKVNTTETNTGYGEMSLSADSSFTGWGHFGVLATDGKTTYVNVDEDYFGTYQMKKTAHVKKPKEPYIYTPDEDWLTCDNPASWCNECGHPEAASW